jgi:hypothetical protein
MNLDHLLSTIDAEISRLQQVRALLAGATTSTRDGKRAVVSVPKKAGRKRTMSPEARARIAEAQRKRWAAAKKVGK